MAHSHQGMAHSGQASTSAARAHVCAAWIARSHVSATANLAVAMHYLVVIESLSPLSSRRRRRSRRSPGPWLRVRIRRVRGRIHFLLRLFVEEVLFIQPANICSVRLAQLS